MSKDRFKTVLICAVAIFFAILVKVLPVVFYAAGKADYDRQNYVKAYYNLKKAYFLNHSDKNIRYYYVKSINHLKPNVDIQKTVFNISQDRYKDAAQNLAQMTIDRWKSNILYNIGDNYIEQVPYNKSIMRWSTFPLKVYIEHVQGYPDYYEDAINRAFNQWYKSTGFISFEYVTDAKNADIVLEYQRTPDNLCTKDGCKYVVAYTNPVIRRHILKKMTITMYDKDPMGNWFSDRELYNTVLHELGHALGVMGHSYNSDDLMHMSNNSNNEFAAHKSDFQYLSPKDLNTVNLLYKLIPDIANVPLSSIDTTELIYAPIVLGTSQDISRRKLKEAENYIKSAPDLAGGYVDLAIAYAELEKYPIAIKALDKALKLSKTPDEEYIIYYNLASIYISMNKPQKALEYANMAKSINNSSEIKDLIKNIKQ